MKKCQQFQHELKSLKEEEIKIKGLLTSGIYNKQIKGYQNKYGSLIDINRRDLEPYLDEFIQFSQELENQSDSIEKDPAISELNNLALKHRNSIKELATARKKILKSIKTENSKIGLSEILDKLDRKIKNFQIKESVDSLAILH